jgi:hypothetical protein
MAKYAMTWQATTAVAVADTANMTDAGYEGFLQGGSATQRLVVSEIYIGGEDTASTVNTIVVARDSTVAATAISGNKNAVLDASNTAPGTLLQCLVIRLRPNHSVRPPYTFCNCL